MYQWVRAYGSDSSVSYHISIFYFVLLMIFGNIVMFSLFTGILLEAFETNEEEVEEDDEPAEKEKITIGDRWAKFQKSFKESFGKRKRKEYVPEEKNENEKIDERIGDMMEEESSMSVVLPAINSIVRGVTINVTTMAEEQR